MLAIRNVGTKMFSSRSRKRRFAIRKSSGVYLVETLVALILGALLCFVLLDILSQTLRVTSANANQLSATFITHTVLDSIKALSFDKLAPGTYPLLVNSSTSGELAISGHPLPVGLNIGYLNWTKKADGNKFPGTVQLDLQPANADSMIAIVTVTWPISTTGKSKTVATYTKIYRQGGNVYGQ